MSAPSVFVSYSHRDELWKDRLLPQLTALERAGRVTVWDDRKIGGGEQWYPEIEEAMAEAAVAVCLISSDYLASGFVTAEEIPYLLERRERDGMIILPVLLRPCVWKAFPWLSETQMLPRDGKSVSRDFRTRAAWETVFAEVAGRVFEIVDEEDYVPPSPAPPRWPEPEKVDIDRMPVTGAELFGRRLELEMLDKAWESPDTHVVSLVAWGGVGKSTLVRRWLERLEADNFRGARRVFAWSFYSQGTGERVTSADQFIAEALQWFGDDNPTEGSPWDKGQRLAGLVAAQKTLLVLDGMEPLQSGLDFERGKVNDPALAMLIDGLACHNDGLCVITTRETVADLTRFPDTTSERNLEQISSEAGRALLRVRGVRGKDEELEAATASFGNHALAVNLLAEYLRDIAGHHISGAFGIPDLDIPDEEGRHPRRVMAAFEERFGDGPEVEVLRMLGLFDRPAEPGEIATLRADPVVPGLTAHVQALDEAGWLRLLQMLRDAGLLAEPSHHSPDALDAHPLVREHFGQRLREQHPDAWREGHSRLYEHLRDSAKALPDTIEEMAPLYAAVAHGCQAGRHQEARAEVYRERIQRGNEFFSKRQLGAFASDLAALSGFFEPPWSAVVDVLSEADTAWLLNEAGSSLRALGRLREAAQSMRAGLEARIQQENWRNAAINAGNLSQLYLIIGDVGQGLEFGQQGVELADRSKHTDQQRNNRAALADAHHQAGRLAESEALFHAAEEMQKRGQPESQFLYGLGGFQYCDLLLDQGKFEDVRRRAEKGFELRLPSDSLLDIGLEHLSLGRALVLQAEDERTQAPPEAARQLDEAVDGLRRAGTQQYIPSGLLARAELHGVARGFHAAERDLEEALAIAGRDEMGLHQADALLGYARLHLAMGERDKARESLTTAKKMIADMGYHRRDGEVEELQRELA